MHSPAPFTVPDLSCLYSLSPTSAVMSKHAAEGGTMHAKHMTQKNMEPRCGTVARLPQTAQLFTRSATYVMLPLAHERYMVS